MATESESSLVPTLWTLMPPVNPVANVSIIIVTDEKNRLEQKDSTGLYVFMRLKCQALIQTSIPPDTGASVWTATTQLNSRQR